METLQVCITLHTHLLHISCQLAPPRNTFGSGDDQTAESTSRHTGDVNVPLLAAMPCLVSRTSILDSSIHPQKSSNNPQASSSHPQTS